MNVTASALFWMTMDACMLESPCREIHREAPTRLCLQLNSETCTKFQKAKTPPWEAVGRLPTSRWHGRPPANHPFVVETKKGGQPTRKPGRPTTFCPWILVFCNTKQ